MKYAIAILIGIICTLAFLLHLSQNKVDKLNAQILYVNSQAEIIEQKIKNENEKLQNEINKQRTEIKQLDEKRIIYINNARASFLAERLRLQADSESCREKSVSLSRANSNHVRSAAETERLLLRTLDEAERINAAYASCVMLIEKPL
jgi:septal ring factor EnvC (AmiA/AmiB activator)